MLPALANLSRLQPLTTTWRLRPLLATRAIVPQPLQLQPSSAGSRWLSSLAQPARDSRASAPLASVYEIADLLSQGADRFTRQEIVDKFKTAAALSEAQFATVLKATELQARLESLEARRKAEAEAAEAKRKAEAEAAEAKRKAEEEAAEARRKAEAEAAEARRKAEAEVAEARRKAQAEAAKAWAEAAEARRVAEVEAAEARRKAEAEAANAKLDVVNATHMLKDVTGDLLFAQGKLHMRGLIEHTEKMLLSQMPVDAKSKHWSREMKWEKILEHADNKMFLACLQDCLPSHKRTPKQVANRICRLYEHLSGFAHEQVSTKVVAIVESMANAEGAKMLECMAKKVAVGYVVERNVFVVRTPRGGAQ